MNKSTLVCFNYFRDASLAFFEYNTWIYSDLLHTQMYEALMSVDVLTSRYLVSEIAFIRLWYFQFFRENPTLIRLSFNISGDVAWLPLTTQAKLKTIVRAMILESEDFFNISGPLSMCILRIEKEYVFLSVLNIQGLETYFTVKY